MLQCAANVMKIRGSSYEKHKDFSDTQPVIDAAEKISDGEAVQIQIFLDEIPTGVKKTAGGLDLGNKWQILGNAEVYAGGDALWIHTPMAEHIKFFGAKAMILKHK